MRLDDEYEEWLGVKDSPPGDVVSEKKDKGFRPPTEREVADYCKEMGYNVTPELFMAHYEENGWRRGKENKMKSWKGTCRTWHLRNKDRVRLEPEKIVKMSDEDKRAIERARREIG